MAEKKTKRLGFNFLRSYFDVFNELDNDADKLTFLTAIINKQFLNEDPKDMNFIINLCYQSQKHAIEKSVKGWISANQTDLQGNPLAPLGGSPKGSPPLPNGQVQVQEEVQEKEKEELITTIYEKFVAEIKKGGFQTRIESLYMRLRIKEGSLTPLLKDFKLHIIEENRTHKDTNDFFINFKNWLNVQDRNKLLDKYKK